MKRALAVISALFVLFCSNGNAQIYKFQQYSIDRGLTHHFVYSIAQDKHGFIWFATGMGLCRYDGFNFIPPDSDILPLTNVTTSYKDDSGNLWFGYNDGLTVKYDGFNFSIADTSASKTAVTSIIKAPDGEILVATQTGITRFFDRRLERIDAESLNSIMINTICFADRDKLLVGSFDGLHLFNYGSDVSFLSSIEEFSNISVVSVTPKIDGNGYWVVTEEDGIYCITVNGNGFTTIPLNIPELAYTQVHAIYEDTGNNLWISTSGKGLLRVNISPGMEVLKTNIYNNSNGLGSDYVRQAFFDNRQNLWVATSGQGVACITNLAFSFLDELGAVGNNATAIFSHDKTEYWIAGMGAIIRISAKQKQERTITGRANGLPNENITALAMDDAGNLWIGSEKSGLYKLSKNAQNVSQFYREENSLSNTIQKIVIVNDEIWMATRNGVLVIDIKTGKKTEHYSTSSGGLPHNWIKDIFRDSKNRIWIATNSNSLIDIKNHNKLFLQEEYEIAEFSTITEDDQGRIWAATSGKGVYAFDEARDTVLHFTTDNGLMSDYCYAMTFDGNGQIWIGHRLGMSSINSKHLNINVMGKDKGIYGDVNPLAVILNKSGEMLVGMTDGVMLYDVMADQTHEQVPMLNLTGVLINDMPRLTGVHVNEKQYGINEPIELPYGGRKGYKLQFDFVGLQYSDPNSVSYQYFLDDYDIGWSLASKTKTAVYSHVLDGTYNLWIKACNSNNCTGETMLITVKVRKPFWKRWWFMLSAVAFFFALGYAIITIRERNHRILQEYLENELKERTKEVHRQKEVIEMKNKDITDSINYAQRIQVSVLPSINTLLEYCSEAFIFYSPRDIVSGDFYWFDYFPKTGRLLVVCADSTGHGVPGAFMSLIGTTLIKDITMLPGILNPADVLYQLDRKIQSTLNSNSELERANDGMDLVVCEINTETHLVKIASAMRPYIVFHKGTPTVYKGSLSSIGGQQSIENKVFETVELQLSKNDTIYMFSDGYADQFGGPSGKRMKMSRVQNIINDVYNRDMNEQYRVIKENFNLWKGENEQIDDVLMMGVRI